MIHQKIDPFECLLDANGISKALIEATLGGLMLPSVTFVDLFCQRSQHEHWLLEENAVKQAECDLEQGFGLRVVSGDKHGFAYSDDLSKQAIADAANSVKGIISTGDSGSVALARQSYSPLYQPDNPIVSLSDEAKVQLLHEANRYAHSKDSRVKRVVVGLSGQLDTIVLAHSSGLLTSDQRPLAHFQVQVVVESNGRTEQGSASLGRRSTYEHLLTLEGIHQTVDRAIHQAVVNLDSRPAPAGEMAVVLGPGWPGILLHEAVGHGLEADFNRKGSSVYSGRVGEQVASSLCTIIDEGTIPERRGSLTIDDEGVPTQTTTLIEEGRLVGYMQDRQNAALMGAELTGNGRREGYSSLPMPRMTNTYLRAGESNPKEILASLDRGVYAVDFSGGQVDITSGQFVFCMSEAYWVENGQIQYPIKGATLIGNGPEVLGRVSMVGDDLALDPGMGVCGKFGQSVPVGVGQPTVKIDQIVVGGQQIA